MFELTDRDYAIYALPDIDLEAQHLAVRSLLSRNRTADEALIEEITVAAGRPRYAAAWPSVRRRGSVIMLLLFAARWFGGIEPRIASRGDP